MLEISFCPLNVVSKRGVCVGPPGGSLEDSPLNNGISLGLRYPQDKPPVMLVKRFGTSPHALGWMTSKRLRTPAD